eukprot:Skav203701  [mRNA]  locus=scaffold259:305956:308707:+ [translate_table: standard]
MESEMNSGRKGLKNGQERHWRLLVEDPRWPDSHHWRARSLVRLQQREEARKALKMAQLCAEEPRASWGPGLHTPRRGNEAYRTQQWSLAKECYDRAIAADSLRMDVELSAQLFCNRAAVQARLHQPEAAVQDCGTGRLPQKFKEVQEAFEVLSDPLRRQELDGIEDCIRCCNACLWYHELLASYDSR